MKKPSSPSQGADRCAGSERERNALRHAIQGKASRNRQQWLPGMNFRHLAAAWWNNWHQGCAMERHFGAAAAQDPATGAHRAARAFPDSQGFAAQACAVHSPVQASVIPPVPRLLGLPPFLGFWATPRSHAPFRGSEARHHSL